MAMYEEYMCEFKFLEEKLRIYTKRKKNIRAAYIGHNI